MSFRKLLLPFYAVLCVFCLASLGGRASAQAGVYGIVTGERVDGVTCLDPTGRCASPNGLNHPYGGTFGVLYDWKRIGPINLGFDARGSVLNENKRADLYADSTDYTRFYTALVGVRASLPRPVLHLVRPYAQISGGWSRSNLQVSAATSYNPSLSYANFGQVQAFAGADIRIVPFLDFRAIELGAGEMFGPTSHNVLSIGSGVVFRLP